MKKTSIAALVAIVCLAVVGPRRFHPKTPMAIILAALISLTAAFARVCPRVYRWLALTAITVASLMSFAWLCAAPPEAQGRAMPIFLGVSVIGAGVSLEDAEKVRQRRHPMTNLKPQGKSQRRRRMKTGLTARPFAPGLRGDSLRRPAGGMRPRGMRPREGSVPHPVPLKANWQKALFPKDAAKPPANRWRTPSPRGKAGDREGATPRSPSRTLDSGFMEQELVPDSMGMAQKVLPGDPDPGAPLQLGHQPGDLPRGYKGRHLFRREGGDGQHLGEERLRQVPRGEEGREDMYSTTPSELYFVCDGAVYTMVAMPMRIPAQTVQLICR